MKPDNFEKELQGVPMRKLPSHWRKEILGAAREVHSAEAVQPARFAWLRELLWPCPQAWAGLAAVWIFILGAQWGGNAEAPRQVADATTPSPKPVGVMTLGMLDRRGFDMIDSDEPTAELPRPSINKPRSEIAVNLVIL